MTLTVAQGVAAVVTSLLYFKQKYVTLLPTPAGYPFALY